MKLADLDFSYPENLVAKTPQHPPRVMLVEVPTKSPQEISFQQLLELIPPGDLLIINNTKVLKRRVFSGDLEILFLQQKSALEWEVLFPSRKYKLGQAIALPGGVQMILERKGRPQLVRLTAPIGEDYFASWGELPLPPYIQRAREQRHTVKEDEAWYQTAWATSPGSFAAPTASLHFREKDLVDLRSRGVKVLEITLHVGLGTFLPVTAEDLNQHDMHEEQVEISKDVWQLVQSTKASGGKVWALGTTATRALESAAQGVLAVDSCGHFKGFTKILIQPPYNWRVVDRLLTNFHQPQSTLLALVSAFAGPQQVKACYQWAVEREFRLFSYGDLSVWIR